MQHQAQSVSNLLDNTLTKSVYEIVQKLLLIGSSTNNYRGEEWTSTDCYVRGRYVYNHLVHAADTEKPNQIDTNKLFQMELTEDARRIDIATWYDKAIDAKMNYLESIGCKTLKRSYFSNTSECVIEGQTILFFFGEVMHYSGHYPTFGQIHYYHKGFTTDVDIGKETNSATIQRLIKLAQKKQWHSGGIETKDCEPVGKGWTKINKVQSCDE